MSSILLAAAIAALPTCRPVPGAEALFANPAARVVWVGEVHGTVEQPALFGNLVCAALKIGRPVVVALEQSDKGRPLFDAFMASDGKDAARSALLQAPWTGDGRGSEAMVAMVERLRQYLAAGADLVVRPISPTSLRSNSEPGAWDKGMVAAVIKIEAERPSALVLVFSGNVHAQKSPIDIGGSQIPGHPTAANLLPKAEVISVYLSSRKGLGWYCQGASCGPHPIGFKEAAPLGVVRGAPSPAFDFTASTGVPASASPPAKPGS